MVFIPSVHLAGDGIKFNELNLAGRAEIRAYYVGTALCISFACWYLPTDLSLRAIAVVLGGFASSRVLSYYQDGVDSVESLRNHQNLVFTAEVIGTIVTVFLIISKTKSKRR